MLKIKFIASLSLILLLQGCSNTNLNQANNKPATQSADPVIANQKLGFYSVRLSSDKKLAFYSKANNTYDQLLGVTSVDESYYLKNIEKNDKRSLNKFKLEKEYYLEQTRWLNNSILVLVFYNNTNTKVIKYDVNKDIFSEIFNKPTKVKLTDTNLYFNDPSKIKKLSLLDQKESDLSEYQGQLGWEQSYINNQNTFIINEVGLYNHEPVKFSLKLEPPSYYQQSIINLVKKSVNTEVKETSEKYNLFMQKDNRGFSEDGLKLGRFSDNKIEVINLETDQILFKKEFQNTENKTEPTYGIWLDKQKFAYYADKKLFIYDLETNSELKTIDLPEHFNVYSNISFSGNKLIFNNGKFFAVLNLSDYSFKEITSNFNSEDLVYSNYLSEIDEPIISKLDSNEIFIIDENNSMKRLFTAD